MTSYAVRTGVLSCDLDGQVVLLDAASGVYFQLNETGGEIWRRLSGGDPVDRIVAVLVAAYGADEQQARCDVETLLADLRAHDLVT